MRQRERNVLLQVNGSSGEKESCERRNCTGERNRGGRTIILRSEHSQRMHHLQLRRRMRRVEHPDEERNGVGEQHGLQCRRVTAQVPNRRHHLRLHFDRGR